ncbi:unnamed protein product [Dicrocoelium dendriticum]|nr:unnamed protein product [Dicrocoelium dendriticum]
MGVLGRILLMVACAIGAICCIAAIVEYRDEIKSEYKSERIKGTIACLFIEAIIFGSMIVFLFITLCCPCSDLLMGVVIGVGGGATAIFAAIAFGLMSKTHIGSIPQVGEWTFAGIFSGVSVVLIALTLAVS